MADSNVYRAGTIRRRASRAEMAEREAFLVNYAIGHAIEQRLPTDELYRLKTIEAAERVTLRHFLGGLL